MLRNILLFFIKGELCEIFSFYFVKFFKKFLYLYCESIKTFKKLKLLFLLMKGIITYINETIDSNNVKYLGYSMKEMIADYDILDDYPTMAQKKEIALKYGIESKKVKEIEHEILLQMRALRFEKKDFDNTDIRFYYKLDVPEKTKLQRESTAFIMFLKDSFFKRMQERKLDKKVSLAKIKDWNYHLSWADRSLILDYLKCIDILDSRDATKLETKKAKGEVIEGIRLQLVAQTKDFYEQYLNDAEAWAIKTYDAAPGRLEYFSEKRRNFEIKLDEVVGRLKKEDGWRYMYSPEYREIDKSISRISRSINELKMILNKTKIDFIQENREDAENTFNRNIANLAEKLYAKEFEFSKITVNSISNDPKLFELEVTDGNITLYARSIWAAEWSDKMIPHFRFIITNRRKR